MSEKAANFEPSVYRTLCVSHTGGKIARCKWFPICKWVIGQFSSRRWAKRLQNCALRLRWFLNHNLSFENRSFVDFQILSEKSCELREISSRKFWKSAADGAILKKDCGERSSDEFPKDDSLGYIWSSTESAHRWGCRSGACSVGGYRDRGHPAPAAGPTWAVLLKW